MSPNAIMILCFLSILALLSYVNGADIEACMAAGNSYETCNHTVNR